MADEENWACREVKGRVNVTMVEVKSPGHCLNVPLEELHLSVFSTFFSLFGKML